MFKIIKGFQMGLKMNIRNLKLETGVLSSS